jgi:hypothetical protein
MIDYTTNNFGDVTVDGTLIHLTQQAFIENYGTDGDVRYYAHGVDEAGVQYRVAWELTPERKEQEERHRADGHVGLCDCNDDESIACDWDAPVEAREV